MISQTDVTVIRCTDRPAQGLTPMGVMNEHALLARESGGRVLLTTNLLFDAKGLDRLEELALIAGSRYVLRGRIEAAGRKYLVDGERNPHIREGFDTPAAWRNEDANTWFELGDVRLEELNRGDLLIGPAGDPSGDAVDLHPRANRAFGHWARPDLARNHAVAFSAPELELLQYAISSYGEELARQPETEQSELEELRRLSRRLTPSEN